MKRVLSLLLAVLLVLTLPVAVCGAREQQVQAVHDATGAYLAGLGTPVAGGLGGEWMALGLARSGQPVADSYYDSVVAYVQEHMDENGRLHATKSSVNCRFIVALTALGRDVTDVGGYDLLSGLNDLNYIKKVGVTGVIWTLIAFDCGDYRLPSGLDRQTLVDEILNWRTSSGGWANAGDVADPDVTAMALQALAPYRQENAAVAAAVDQALVVLSAMQDSTGNFPSQYGSSSESIAQIIVALSALGIDSDTDPRFVKDGVSALDGLLSYAFDGGGFRHILSGGRDGMATEQGYYALTAYLRMKAGKTSLYDMSDLRQADAPQQPDEPQQPDVPQQPDQTREQSSFLWAGAVLAAAAVAAALTLIFRKKLGRRRAANMLMVVVILAVAVVGIGLTLQLRQESQSGLGSLFQITPIPGDRLVSDEGTENLCTIAIYCRTVLDNVQRLEEAKVPYVPVDGVILSPVTVEFTPGETVFQVLQRVCQAAEIPLEYSWTPLYDSYYLEGINHLYEYDCGTESGWMYQVNGIYPNYGCSAYTVKAGDVIVWNYTCVGLGADLGAEKMEG